MRRLILIAAVGLVAGSSSTAFAQGPGVAIGKIHQEWNVVTIDYGVGDPATTELHVFTHDGRDVVVDRKTALDGTLVWDRKIDNHHVAPGHYRLDVVATNSGGSSRAVVSIDLGLLYMGTGAQTRHNSVMLRYTLAAESSVRLFVRKLGTKRWFLAEVRTGNRGKNQITWDFRIRGRRVTGGHYRMLLRAVSLG